MISLARETLTPRLGRSTIYFFRLILAIVWIFDGIRRALSEESLVGNHTQLAETLGMSSSTLAIIVGSLEVIMGLWLIAGWMHRGAILFQSLLFIFTLWIGFSNGWDLLADIVGFLPMLTLMAMVWGYGPGNYVWRKNRRSATWTRG